MVTESANVLIRPLDSIDQSFLWEMLYQALYVGEGDEPFPRDVLNRPEISRYAENWGLPDDTGFVAIDESDERAVAAVWIRLMKGANKGYGYVDESTPELSIAVLPEYRGRGIGTKLLLHLLRETQSRYSAISLSVSSNNPAFRLYQRLGFKVVSTNDTSLTMLRSLTAN